MTASINPIIHNAIAESMLREIQTQSARYYYFLGKTLPYNLGVEIVEIPTNDYKYELSCRREIIEMKRISSSDITFVVPRYDWVSGTVYSQYDDVSDISNDNFYVLTSGNNVYKCLDNNYGAVSTVEPTGVDASSFMTADGYKWKFMLSIPLSLRNKFMTAGYIPVTNAIKSKFYNNGGIDTVSVEYGGTGYVEGSTTITVQSSTGTGAVLTPVIADGTITDVIIENPGEGYTYADITVSGNDITDSDAIITVMTIDGLLDTVQANVELLAVDGSIECIKVTNQGFGYGYATVNIDGDGSQATAEVVIQDTKIVGIVITNSGFGYTHATVTINGNGSTRATARAIMSPRGGHGKNAIEELYANTLIYYSNISTERNHGFIMNNDFRQFGIIKNPTIYNSSVNYISPFGSTCYSITTVTPNVNNLNIFTTDDELTNLSGERFKIIAVESSRLLLQSYDNATPISGETLTNTSNLETVIVGVVTQPQVDKYSGRIMYIDNRAAFSQTEDQSISLQTAIKF